MNPKLLVVDDERGIVDMIQSYFQTQYDILTAYSGQEALKKVACKPDLILLDINMPGMDGLTVCQQIREHIACPILFLTARIESSDKIIGFQAGADDYIVKPFDLDELGARIAAHLRREQRRQNNSAVRFFGELILDYSARTVTINNQNIPLSKREFEIIKKGKSIWQRKIKVFRSTELLREKESYITEHGFRMRMASRSACMQPLVKNCMKNSWQQRSRSRRSFSAGSIRRLLNIVRNGC